MRNAKRGAATARRAAGGACRKGARRPGRLMPLTLAVLLALSGLAQAQSTVYVAPGFYDDGFTAKAGDPTLVIQGDTTISPSFPVPAQQGLTGVQVKAGGHIIVDPATAPVWINIKGDEVDGLYVAGGNLEVRQGGTYVYAQAANTGKTVRGIYNVGASAASRFDGTQVYVTTDWASSDALRTYGAQASTVLRDSTLTTLRDNSYGARSWDGAQIQMQDTHVRTEGASSHGVIASGAGTRTQMQGGSVTTTGAGSYGVYAFGGARIDTDGTVIHGQGTNGYGAMVMTGGTYTATNSSITSDQQMALYSRDSTVVLDNSTLLSKAAGRHAVLNWDGDLSVNGGSIRSEGDNAHAVWAYGGRTDINGAYLVTQGAAAHGVVAQAGANLTFGRAGDWGTWVQTTGTGADAVRVLADAGGIQATGAWFDARGAGSHALRVDGAASGTAKSIGLSQSYLSATSGSALHAQSGRSAIDLQGSWLRGGDYAITAGPTATTAIRADATRIDGGASVASGGSLGLHLSNGSLWNMQRDSTVSELGNDASLIDLRSAAPAGAPTAAASYQTLNVTNGYQGANGVLVVNTWLNRGGALADQYTDRLLVGGNATGTTGLRVTAVDGSPGGPTAEPHSLGSHEGISVVQVAGSAGMQSYTLEGGYASAHSSPYAYGLYAYGPGSTWGAADPAQNLVGNAQGYWDYRLQNTYVAPDGRFGPDPEDGRPALVPQAPSYLSAPLALQYAGFTDLNALHRRLGEIRDDRALGLDGGNGEAFFRAYGGDFSYGSNRAWRDYGYDFKGDYGAVQLGGNLYTAASDTGIWRFGVAGSLGWLQYRPDAVDGNSRTRADTYRASGYATYQSTQGWYVDSIVSYGWFNGDVRTDARGKALGLHGQSYAASVEAGYPRPLGAGLNLEPQAQVIAQHLRFNRGTDVDGLSVDLGSQTQVLGRLGARLTRPVDLDSGRVTPYVGVDVLHAFNGASDVKIGDTRMRTGQYGDSLQFSLGVTGTVSDRLSLYGQVARQQALGGSGIDGWIFNGGLRWRF